MAGRAVKDDDLEPLPTADALQLVKAAIRYDLLAYEMSAEVIIDPHHPDDPAWINDLGRVASASYYDRLRWQHEQAIKAWTDTANRLLKAQPPPDQDPF